MLSDKPQDLARLAQQLRANNAGNFISAVDSSIERADKRVVMTLRAFYGEPGLLYTALAYASARGVTVSIFPGDLPADSEGEERTG